MCASLFKDKLNFHDSILNQINKAFQTAPNIAATIQGKRKIHQGCYGRRTSLFPSRKCAGAIPLESRLELAHAICLEQNPKVKSYRTQALKINLSQSSVCYPDFLIQTTQGSYEVHEVKPSIANLSSEDVEKFNRLSTLLQSIGIGFRLVDQHSLPNEKQQQQLMFWYQRGHMQKWGALEIDLATDVLKDRKYSDVNEIYIALQSSNLDVRIGDYLLFHRMVLLSTDKPVQEVEVT